MFAFVEKHRRWLMIVLLLLIGAAFSIVGLPMFDFGPGGTNVAEVGRYKISAAEFDDMLQQQRQRIRNSVGPNFDPAVFDTPAWRKEVLEQMIAERLMLDYGQRNHLNVSAAQIRDLLRTVGMVDEDGTISEEKFNRIARSNNLTPEGLLAELRADLLKRQLSAAVEQGAFVPKISAEYFVRRRGEVREVAQLLFPAGQYTGKVEIKPEEIKAYYDEHLDDFRTPEQVRAEYVMLSRESIAAQTQISPEAVDSAYKAAIETKTKAREAARAKAEGLLTQVRANPERFAELAKENSQDPMSAAQGGDLGFYPRGSMVKPFEDAMFSMKPNEIRGLIESQYGFHVIQLLEVRKEAGGEERRARHILIEAEPPPKDLAAARAQIERDLRDREVSKKFGAAIETFKDIAFDQPDTLQGLAKHFNLKIGSSGWVGRNVGPPPFDNPRLIAALFSDDALKERSNTDAVEVAPGRWVAARVVEHKAASVQPLNLVSADVERMLRQEKAMALARKAGEEKLEALRSGQAADTKWSTSAPLTRDRMNAGNKPAVEALFKADVSKLPAYVGVEAPGAGYAVYRISKVTEPEVNEAQIESARYALGQLAALQQRQAFVGALRDRVDVSIQESKVAKPVDE
jgi:peptidyl-prolyl cis-trans isomerase D